MRIFTWVCFTTAIGASVALSAACGSDSTRGAGGAGTGATGGTSGSGTGGTSGGSTTGGNGGAGGACVPQSAGGTPAVPTACSTTAVLTATQSLIEDFECPGENNPDFWGYMTYADGQPFNGYQHGGYTYANDVLVVNNLRTCDPFPGVTVNATGAGTPGNGSSQYALHLNVDKPADNWGGGLGIWVGPTTGATDLTAPCLDASAFTGIRFWMKGTTTQNSIRVSIRTFEIASPPKGTCTLVQTDGGSDCESFDALITLTPDWQQYTLAWADFAQETTNDPASPPGLTLTGAGIQDIGFYISTWSEVETLDVWLDDLEFTGGSGSQLPRDCTAASPDAGTP
jgi:hypothetical protein